MEILTELYILEEDFLNHMQKQSTLRCFHSHIQFDYFVTSQSYNIKSLHALPPNLVL